jgi:Ca-activated chloride channel family protein
MNNGFRNFQKTLVATILLNLCGLSVAQELPGPKQNAAQPRAVKLSVIVTDGSEHSVDDVVKDEVQVFEDHVVQTIKEFSKEDKPVNYAIAIDTSGSFKTLLAPVLEAVKLLINNQRDNDETFIERFISSDRIETTQDFTSDRPTLLKPLPSLYIEGGQSAVIDAVYLAVQHVAEHVPNAERRRALVLFTDGEDRASYYTEKQLFQLLRQNDVEVFVIGIVEQLDKSPRGKAEGLMRRIAQESGGRFFFPKNVNELMRAAAQVTHDLHIQYSVIYESTGNESKENFRSVEVKVVESTGRQKLTAVSRRGYYLNPPALDPKDNKRKSKK